MSRKSRSHGTQTTAIVIGGGISGLIAARELAQDGAAVTVLEASAAFGGSVATHEVAGLTLDSGADSFATRTSAVADLVEELGLADRIVSPHPDGAWLQLDSGAHPLPATGFLGIPADPRDPLVVRIIGRMAAWRASLDLHMPPGAMASRKSVSLGELVRRRMGSTVLNRLVAPVSSGVFAADPDYLDVDAIAPGLRPALAQYGSLARAAGSLRAAAAAGSSVAGLVGGMGRLTDALVADVRKSGVTLRTGTAAESVSRSAEGGWTVRFDGAALEVGTLVVATDGVSAVELLKEAVPDMAHITPTPGPGVALVTLVVDMPELDSRPRGNGVLVADGAQGIAAKALTHVSAKWQWLAEEAGPGTHVLRLSYGRALGGEPSGADPLATPDPDFYAVALRDASLLMGTAIGDGDVVGWDVVRWPSSLPLAVVGSRELAGRVRDIADAASNLHLVGSWLSGAGLAAVVGDTRAHFARVRASGTPDPAPGQAPEQASE